MKDLDFIDDSFNITNNINELNYKRYVKKEYVNTNFKIVKIKTLYLKKIYLKVKLVEE